MVQKLNKIIAPAVEALGYELVGCELQSQPGHHVLRVYVDGPNGVNLDDCAAISRQVGSVLEVEDPICGRYNLEVSSPGLERPLFTLDHYRQFVGRSIKLRLRIPREGQRKFKGIIERVEGEKVTLQLDEELLELSINEIDKANLIADL